MTGKYEDNIIVFGHNSSASRLCHELEMVQKYEFQDCVLNMVLHANVHHAP